MSPRKNVARIAALGLAAAAAAAPAAGAMPTDQSYPSYPTPTPAQASGDVFDQSYPAYPSPERQSDASGGTVVKPDVGRDLRGEATANGSLIKPDMVRDLRGEAAADGPRTAVRPLPGPPTWPEHPSPIAPRVAPGPVTDTGGTDDDFPVVLIALLGALALGGVAVFTITRVRPPSQVAH